MTIHNARKIIKAQLLLERTPDGRRITKEALLTLDASLADQDNHGNEAVQCRGCRYVCSILLVKEGCPNCGIIDMTTKISEE